MDIVIYGAGSLGSLVGGLLAAEHTVTLVGRDPHMAAVTANGLRLTGEYDRTVTPRAVTDGTGLTADLAVVTVKAFDTPAAAMDLATGDVGAVLSLQNGLGNEEQLAAKLPATPVLAGIATYGAVRPEPGVVRCTGTGTVTLGPRTGGTTEVAATVGEAFQESGISTTVATDMPRRLWKKLAINAGINPVTALLDVDNGTLVTDPPQSVAFRAATETATVAQAVGIDLPAETVRDALISVAENTAANTSSMRQDLQGRRRTEIDAINGAVRDRADAHGVPVPVNETLYALVRAREQVLDVAT